MTIPVEMSATCTIPVPAPSACSATLAMPLEDLFSKRFGPIPAITRTSQDGVWATPGQVRTIHLADGGSMREQLRGVDDPTSFSYRITNITGPMKPLVTSIDGLWSFEKTGTGVSVTWKWALHPCSRIVRWVIVGIFRPFWRGYAQRALGRLEGYLLAEYASD